MSGDRDRQVDDADDEGSTVEDKRVTARTKPLRLETADR
jgi:hypothetical protein